MITFENPNFLLLLALLPLIALLHFISLYAFAERAKKFANFETLQRIHKKKRIFSKKIPQLLLRLLFTAVIVFAAAGPSLWIEREGMAEEIIFAMDVSGTMLAEDISPNRLEASKNTLISYINETAPAIDAGVISFTSTPYPEVYPTTDETKIINRVSELNARSSSGTSMGQAINYAVAMLGEMEERERRVIMFTDGQENILNEEELTEVVTKASENQVSTYVIGVATHEGGDVPGLDGEFIVNEETLELIADNNPGEYAITSNQQEINTALAEFIYADTVEVELKLSFWLFLCGFFLLIIEWYLSNYIFRSLS